MSPERQIWIKPSRRGRTKGANVYIDMETWDDAVLSIPKIVKAGIKDAEDLPEGYLDNIRIKRHTLSPGKVVISLKYIGEIEKKIEEEKEPICAGGMMTWDELFDDCNGECEIKDDDFCPRVINRDDEEPKNFPVPSGDVIPSDESETTKRSDDKNLEEYIEIMEKYL